ncbi:hypothetical protein IT568_11095 [bacterium]|nr:hypothetical protein [bacterium]
MVSGIFIVLIFASLVSAQTKEIFVQKSLNSEINSLALTGSARKNPALAGLLSVLVPGFGEFYVGNEKKAYSFLTTEILLFGAYFGMKKYGSSLENDAISFGSLNSGVDLRNKNDDFRTSVALFMSLEEYNLAQIQNRFYGRVYKPTVENNWDWKGSVKNRREFRSSLRDGRDYQDKAKFLGFAIFANHVISAIDASFTARKLNKLTSENFGNKVEVDYTYNEFLREDVLKVIFQTNF